MKKYTWLLIVLCSQSTLLAQTIETLETRLQNALHQEKLIGASWSIIDNDIISTGALGLKNFDNNTKLSAKSKIQIGSITKTLIATGVLRLVSQNKLNLDTPVEQVIPEISFDNPWKQTRKVTVRDLLNHTSGLEDARFWQVFSKSPLLDSPLLGVFTREPDVLTIRTMPGTRFSYSNMGYTMLGLVIQRITGAPYEKYLDENLLKPLGMVNSTFQFVSQKNDRDLAMGHFDDGKTQLSLPMYLRPAGQFTTTAYDMALFAQFLMGDGIIDGQSFIKIDLLHGMGHPKTTESFQNGLNSGYQFGLSYRDRYNVIGYYHSGNVIGYRATFYLFPEQKKAFFISFNADSESADYQIFSKILIDHLKIHHPKKSQDNTSSDLNLNLVEGYYILNPVRFALFEYFDLLFNSIKVTLIDGQHKLKINSLQNDSYDLFPSGENLFRKEDRVSASHVIYQQNDKYIITDGLATYEAVSALYLGSLWLSLILGITGMLTIVIRGLYLAVKKKGLINNQGVAIPFLSILLLFAPIPFFFIQSFIELGDFTVGNATLTIVTGILPIALAFGMIKSLKSNYKIGKLDLMAILLFFQWITVLAFWGLIPFKLWAW